MAYKYSFLEHILFNKTTLKRKQLQSKLNGKTVLITGATFGIGEELTLLLSDFKVNLILVARTQEKLDFLKNKLKFTSAKIYTFRADLTLENEVDYLIEEVKKLGMSLDILVCNAGKSIRRSIWDSLNRYHDFTRTISLNYLANVKLILNFLPDLQKTKGQIINMSAINVKLNSTPKWAAYQASKSAIDLWFESVSPEFKVKNISCTTIYLPLVKTRMILPTTQYANFPAMHPKHVAIKVANSFINQPLTIKPWWLSSVVLANFIVKPFWFSINYFWLKRENK
jgi:short-subunit dehydrogenase